MNDRERERYLKEQLHQLQLRYQKEAEPIVKELVDIEMRRPPKPVVLEDGRVFVYTGPWPWDEDGNRKDGDVAEGRLHQTDTKASDTDSGV